MEGYGGHMEVVGVYVWLQGGSEPLPSSICHQLRLLLPLQVGGETKSRLGRQRVSFSQFLPLLFLNFFSFYHLNKGENHHLLRSCTYRWFPVTAKHTVAGSEQEEVKWGWEWAWWISLFDVCVEMKNSRGSSSSSSSLSHSFTLSHSFDQEKVHESYAGCKMCLLKAKGLSGPRPICPFQTRNVYFCYFLLL